MNLLEVMEQFPDQLLIVIIYMCYTFDTPHPLGITMV